MSSRQPPTWIEAIIAWALPDGLSGDGALGDLAEAFDERAARSGVRANLWYAGQALSIVAYRVFTGSGAGGTTGDSDVLMDVRWSMRSMLRHPGFALSVIGVLGLGIGANVAVFSILDGTMRNTSWWSEPERTAAIWPDNGFSLGQLDMYGDQQAVYRSLGGYVELAFALQLPDGESASVNGVLISPSLFRELAVQPTVGRALDDDDGAYGAERVVIIGNALWKTSFGADPSVVGRRIDIGGTPFTVVGVQGPGARAPGGRAQLWMPIIPDPRDDDFWKAQSFTLVGALMDGRTLDDAQDDLMAFTRTLSSTFPMFFPDGFADGLANVVRADDAQRRLVATPLLLLFAGTVLLLVATALNLGNLLLGRAVDRSRELAVRASLGASRGRVVRQLLVEGLLLTMFALGIALATAAIGGAWIAGLFAGEVVVVSSPVWTPSVLLFALTCAMFAWIVLDGVPVAYFLRSSATTLGVSRSSGGRLQRGLVTGQAALATLLLVSATLLVSTVRNLRSVELGFDPSGMRVAELSTPEDRVQSPAVARELYGRLVDQVASQPGVESVGLTGWLPLRAEAARTPINLQSAPVDPREALRVPMNMVDPGFFEVFGLEALEGRLLTDGDADLTRPTAVVVNETLARTLWPDGSAVGQMIAVDPHAWTAWAPVVGVVRDIRSGSMVEAPGPALYVSLAESPSRDVTLVVRGTGGTLAPIDLAGAVAAADPMVPVRSIAVMDEVVRAAYATSWVVMGLLSVLAVLATGLGALGIHAVLAHHVARSRKEIGIRMALGARPRAVVVEIVRSGMMLTGAGIALGIVGAVLSTRFLDSILFGVSALAPGAFVSPVVALTVAAMLAAWIPAARAGALPPSEALRGD